MSIVMPHQEQSIFHLYLRSHKNNFDILLWMGWIFKVFIGLIFLSVVFSNAAIADAQVVSGSDLKKIRQIVRQNNDTASKELLEWALLMAGEQKDYLAASRFLQTHPKWPLQHQMKAQVEALMPQGLVAQKAIDWFRKYPPESGRGLLIYLDRLKSLKRDGEIKRVLKAHWATTPMGLKEQSVILQKYNAFIPFSLHQERLDWLLINDLNTTAKELSAFMGRGYPQLARARIGLRKKTRGINSLIDKVPASLKNDPGLVYERIKWRRQKGLNQDAISLLQATSSLKGVVNARAWWRERHILVRRLIEEKKYRQAYTLASGHLQQEGFSELQAEWVSGFIALRLLKDPLKAFPHFEKLYYKAETSISKARGAYWAGQAAKLVAGKQQITAQWLQIAAQHPHTYYGQAAAEQKGITLRINETAIKPKVLSQRERTILLAYKHLKQHRLDHLSSLFISRIMNAYEDQPEVLIYITKWVAKTGYRSDALRLAKKLAQRNILIFPEAYPKEPSVLRAAKTHATPTLVHAVIRQESLFNNTARSSAGARGLMQLLPSTAKETAKKLGIKHRTEWLIAKPAHNVHLGSAYLDTMLQRYNNSPPLALAAYNAGPGRVDRWLKEFGDPRTNRISMEDWIELIPIYETRNYVQRILENERVYRIALTNQI